MHAAGQHRDLRGPLSRLGRLAPFHPEGFIHVVAYRVMVPLMILFGALVFVYLFVPGLGALLKVSTAVIWVLWTPQLFEVARGLSLAWSRGMAYGKLNAEFAHLYRKRYGRATAHLVAFPWVVLVLWAAGFIVLVAWWHP